MPQENEFVCKIIYVLFKFVMIPIKNYLLEIRIAFWQFLESLIVP